MPQFKPELAALIMAGKKTQTRRPYHPGDRLEENPLRVMRRLANGKMRQKWAVGGVQAVQPGRSKKGIGFLEYTNIRYEDVRDISLTDAKAEGFTNRLEFLTVWMSFYDPAVKVARLERGQWQLTIDGVDTYNAAKKGVPGAIRVRAKGIVYEGPEQNAISLLKLRPESLYLGWALTFHVHQPQGEVLL